MTALSLIQAAAGTAAQAAGGEGLSFSDVVLEYLKFAGYFLSIGATAYRYLILPRFEKGNPAVIGRGTAATLGILGVLLLILSALGGVELRALAGHKSFVQSMPKAIGRFQFQLIALALSMVGYAMAKRASAVVGWPVAALGIIAVVLQPLYTARSFSGRVNAVHILAASTWLGTLTVMLFAGIRTIANAPAGGLSRQRVAANIVNAFTPVALTAATVVGITGLTTAWLHIKRLPNLWGTDYGRALIVKLCLVAAVVTMGWWNWKRVKPSLAGGDESVAHLNRSATTEVILAAIVLAATAVLVSLPSPR
jgi:putative copper export protein